MNIFIIFKILKMFNFVSNTKECIYLLILLFNIYNSLKSKEKHIDQFIDAKLHKPIELKELYYESPKKSL